MTDTPAIAELKRLLPLVTPGEWLAAAKPSSIVGWPIVAPQDMGRSICNVTVGHEQSSANAAFIAAAKNAMPALIAAWEENARLRTALDELVTACEEDCAGPGTEDFEDNEAVASSQRGDSALTFGMIRRARAALEGKP